MSDFIRTSVLAAMLCFNDAVNFAIVVSRLPFTALSGKTRLVDGEHNETGGRDVGGNILAPINTNEDMFVIFGGRAVGGSILAAVNANGDIFAMFGRRDVGVNILALVERVFFTNGSSCSFGGVIRSTTDGIPQ